MLKKHVTLLFAALLILIAPLNGLAAEKTFSDVKNNYWGYPSIKWVNDKGLFGGYADGTFRPNETFTEAQFVTVMSRYFENFSVSNDKVNGHWSQSFYNAFEKYQLPLKGYDNDGIKGAPVTRGTIAQVISASQGGLSDLEGAVKFMYDNNLSKGKTGAMTFKDYGVEDQLTRTQAAVFFKRLYDNGLNKIVSNLAGMSYLATKDSNYADFYAFAAQYGKRTFYTHTVFKGTTVENNIGESMDNFVAIGIRGNYQNHLTYPLLGKFSDLSFRLSLSSATKNTNQITSFKVFGDDKELYSTEIKQGFIPSQVDVGDLEGVQVLKFELTALNTKNYIENDTEILLEDPNLY